MEAAAVYSGSIGEIIQGKFDNRDILLSCPVNLFTKVKLFESNNCVNRNNCPKSAQFLKNILTEWDYSAYDKKIDIAISSQIPKGKGFASSTADICAVYYALLKMFNKRYNQEELIRHCIKIEPTDSIIFDGLTIFDYKKGLYKKYIGHYLQFHLLVFEGNRVIDTVEYNRKELPPLERVDDLISSIMENTNVETIAKAATESIVRNQRRLNYAMLPRILKLQKDTGGLGVIGAHSGDVLAVVYNDEQTLNKAMKKAECCEGCKIYKLKSINKEQISSDINFGGNYGIRTNY